MKIKSLSYLVFGCLILSPSILSAQQLKKPPVLLAKAPKGKKSSPLKVSQFSANVIVTGNTAQTTMTLTFRNDTDRVLEGELVFPLNEGTTISGYALEVNGKMREGVVVEKNFARTAYEETIRKEIDPGLVEWTKGNNFRTRIYPIPAKGTKKVSISYEETLRDSAKDTKNLAYSLPLAFAEKIDDFQLRIKVVKPDGEQKIIVDNNAGLDLQLKDKNQWELEARQKNFVANQSLVLQIPKEALPNAISFKSKDGSHYFYIADHKIEAQKSIARSVPKRVKIIWDASHSGAERDIEKEFELLIAYLSQEEIESVELEVIRNEVTKLGVFKNDKAGFVKVIKTLAELDYDGATRLGLIDITNTEADTILIFSDGITTLGNTDSFKNFKGKTPVFTIHCSQSAEHALLRSIALRSQGAYINLKTTDAVTAYKRMTEQAFSLISVTGQGVKEVYPSIATPVNGTICVSGLLKQDVTEVTLNYGIAGNILSKHTFNINTNAGDVDASAIGRLWAQKKLAELELDAEQNEAEIIELAKAHKIVTRYTSLLVLDRMEDYVRYAIAPPEPELLKEYERLLKEVPDEKEADAEFRNVLLKEWQEMVAWHEKKPVDVRPLLVKKVNGLFAAAEKSKKILEGNAKDAVRDKVAMEKWTKQMKYLRELSAKKAMLGAVNLNEEQKLKLMVSILEHHQDVYKTMFKRRPQVGGGLAAPSAGDAFEMEEEGSGSTDGGGDPFDDGGEPAELPNAVAEGDGSNIFPVTPATPTDGISKAAKKGDRAGAALPEPEPKIKLQEWNPDTPYLKTLLKAAGEKKSVAEQEQLYFKLKKDYPKNSGFYLDVAQFFAKQKQERIALRILSTVAELDMENPALLRILAHRYDQLGHHDLAELIFREVLTLRDEEPQSYRDLALVLEKKGEYQEAADLLWQTSMSVWDERFRGFQLITLTEFNALIAKNSKKVKTDKYDSRFIRNLDCDIRIVLTWDADNTDMDLWVTDLLGEQCDYSHNLTATGGRMSDDLTQGYGPEVFMIKKALPGIYRVNTEFFGNSQQNLAGETTIQATLITNWGRPNEKREAITLRLKEEKELVDIGKLEFE